MIPTERDAAVLPGRLVRVKLSPETDAPPPDPLGRAMIGYRDGLSTGELWERGRGVWKFKAAKAVSADWLLIVFDDIVRLVGTVDGLAIHGDRLAITGTPRPDLCPPIGRRDPLFNRSSNPIAYSDTK